MSALKHGLFYASFMLCDRCLINASCKRFQTGSQCLAEKEAYEGLINELTQQYELDMVADRIPDTQQTSQEAGQLLFTHQRIDDEDASSATASSPHTVTSTCISQSLRYYYPS